MVCNQQIKRVARGRSLFACRYLNKVLTRPLGQGLYFSNKGGETYGGTAMAFKEKSRVGCFGASYGNPFQWFADCLSVFRRGAGESDRSEKQDRAFVFPADGSLPDFS